MSLLSPCNQNSVLHIFLLSLYAIPIIFIIYALVSYKLSFSDETVSLFKKIYYIIWILAYIILVNHVELNKISIKDSFGVPYNMWTLIIIFIIFLMVAYLLDIFILFGNGFKELSIFGAKFVKEDREAITIQQKNTQLFLKKTQAANTILIGLRKYIKENDFSGQIIKGKFHIIQELVKIIKKYYEIQYLGANVNVITVNNAKEDIEKLSSNYNIDFVKRAELKRHYKHSNSYIIEQNNRNVLFIPYTSDIYVNEDRDNKSMLVVIEAEKDLMLEEQYTIMSIITLYEAEILEIINNNN
ncbi:hypothetical protein [Clostridium felsineum]|uniref:hypothetical protein n=1 Tax=Clostridium felsineum TaxID=36839 RepID=UPI00098BD5EA|nr:hypothetical protein [Clostridium felsineum]URZ15488.1 hypothetical protein CLFE_015280 [Clostridium felsineum DSM 794]